MGNEQNISVHKISPEILSQTGPLPGAAQEQTDAITAEAKKSGADLMAHNFGRVDSSDRIVTRGQQQFAVFGRTAYELMSMAVQAPEGLWVYQPAISAGHAHLMMQSEGGYKVLHWMYSPRHPGWGLAWLRSGWIHAEELSLSADQIADNIASEIEAGETPLTGLSDRPEYQ